MKILFTVDAPKVGGANIVCASYSDFPEKIEKQASETRKQIEKVLLL